jgi:peptidoglycan hydrolase-like protein with peptidoglycan-binding domain
VTTRQRALLAAGTALAVVIALAAPAAAKRAPRAVGGGETEMVTLKAGRPRLRFGTTTSLYGRITPASGGENVEIVDVVRDRVVASDTADSTGRFALRYQPRRNVRLVARWVAVTSEPVRLRVKPIVSLNLYNVKLFGRAKILGRVTPRMPGRKIKIKLARAGKVTFVRRVRLRKGRYIRTKALVRKPGIQRARAVLVTPDYLNGYAGSQRRSTPLPRLSIGSRTQYVNLLERRLIRLGYYLPGHNRAYDVRTADAMRAFNKVQRRARVGSPVDDATWYRLASPRRPRPRYSQPGYHIEINQSRQVIYLVSAGKVTRILHTSTGANGATRDGTWTVHRKLAGYSGNRLYYPSYFDGLRAIHGWPEVPTYPASHGCARVPMWAATWIYSKAPIGTRVYVYH